ncbi:hypothetical protein GW17_00007258 [Ensete ventricosum]|nr:hypothetical protein GW17_00007258 [Ensete ventricosum]
MDSSGASCQSGPERTFFWSLVPPIKHVVRDQRSRKRRSETCLSSTLVLLVNGGGMVMRGWTCRKLSRGSTKFPAMFRSCSWLEWQNGIQIVVPSISSCSSMSIVCLPMKFPGRVYPEERRTNSRNKKRNLSKAEERIVDKRTVPSLFRVTVTWTFVKKELG